MKKGQGSVRMEGMRMVFRRDTFSDEDSDEQEDQSSRVSKIIRARKTVEERSSRSIASDPPTPSSLLLGYSSSPSSRAEKELQSSPELAPSKEDCFYKISLCLKKTASRATRLIRVTVGLRGSAPHTEVRSVACMDSWVRRVPHLNGLRLAIEDAESYFGTVGKFPLTGLSLGASHHLQKAGFVLGLRIHPTPAAPTGTLYVKMVGGNRIICEAATLNRLQLDYGENTVISRPFKNTDNPRWGETVRFTLEESRTLDLAILSSDPATGVTNMQGTGELDFSRLPERAICRYRVEMTQESAGPAIVTLLIAYRTDNQQPNWNLSHEEEDRSGELGSLGVELYHWSPTKSNKSLQGRTVYIGVQLGSTTLVTEPSTLQEQSTNKKVTLPMNEVSDVLRISAYEDALYGVSRELGSVTVTPATLHFPVTTVLRDHTGTGVCEVRFVTKLKLKREQFLVKLFSPSINGIFNKQIVQRGRFCKGFSDRLESLRSTLDWEYPPTTIALTLLLILSIAYFRLYLIPLYLLLKMLFNLAKIEIKWPRPTFTDNPICFQLKPKQTGKKRVAASTPPVPHCFCSDHSTCLQEDLMEDNSADSMEEITSVVGTLALCTETWSAVEEWRLPLVSATATVLLLATSIILSVLPTNSVLVMLVVAVAAERLLHRTAQEQSTVRREGFVVTECLGNLLKNFPLDNCNH